MKFTVIDPIDPITKLLKQDLFEYIKTKSEYKQCQVFRFCSLVMYGIPLTNLFPSPVILKLLKENEYGDGIASKEFDIAYANQLLTNPLSFVDLIQLIGSFQFCEETFLLSETSKNMITNSLLKFIYERYSIRSCIVQDTIDIDELKVSDFESNEGYSNFIYDIDRYKMLYFTKEQIAQEVIE